MAQAVARAPPMLPVPMNPYIIGQSSLYSIVRILP